MNFGLRKAFNNVAAPRIAAGFSSPTSVWNIRADPPSQVNSWDLLLNVGTVTLPANAAIGDQVAYYLNGSEVTATFNAPLGTTINGLSSVICTGISGGFGIFQKLTNSIWTPIQVSGNDAGIGAWFRGPVILGGGQAGSKIIALANGTASTDAVAFGQLSNGQIKGSLLATQNFLTPTTYTVASSLTALDTTNATLAFTVPASGNVYIDVQCAASLVCGAGLSTQLYLGILNHTGGAQLGYSKTILAIATAAEPSLFDGFHKRFYITGLTPGAFQIDVAASYIAGTGNAGYIIVADSTGTPTAGTGEPLLIQAFAA